MNNHYGTATLVLIALVLAGCTGSAPEPTQAQADPLIDQDRPDTTFQDIKTGPAAEPDLDATTAAPPQLVEGEWWRIRFESGFYQDVNEVVRVVANATDEGYVFGMPHEGWFKEAIAYHAPAFGDVALDLSYNVHNVRFEPVRFPLIVGNTWEVEFATASYTATVESADEHKATIRLDPPDADDTERPVTEALGLAGMPIRLIYDARQHEVVQMDSGIGRWSVIEHGYDFEGWVTVPRGEDTAIDYGTFWPAGPDAPVTTRRVDVEGGFNRLTMMQLIAPLSPGQYSVRSVTPSGNEFTTTADGLEDNPIIVRFYEESQPDGQWMQYDDVVGAAATYSMGIAYHQYDIQLPSGQLRSDHHHPVIR